jgi:hypothetical protein
MINLAQFVRSGLSSEQLAGYVIEDSGGDYSANILQPTSLLFNVTLI